MNPNAEQLQVVVVGAGPVGLVAALALKHEGFDPVVLESDAEDAERPGSRATYLYRESLDLLEGIAPGVTEPLKSASFGWNALRTTYRGKEVYSRRFQPAPAGAFGVAVSQPDQEAVFRERCAAEGIEIRWGQRVLDASTDADGVDIQLEGGASIRADFVIAADGARSTVRRSLGLSMEGEQSNTAFVIVDLAVDSVSPECQERAFHYEHPAVGGRNVLVAPFGGGLRIDLQCEANDKVEEFQADPMLTKWVTAVVGEGYVFPPLWVSTYRFHRAVAQSYTDEHARVLLAGEAAHLFPPFGGARGLNSGIPDAVVAAEAIGTASRADSKVESRRAIGAAAEERRQAGLANRDAASIALDRMEARSWWRRAQRWWAAFLSPVIPQLGRWLDRGPTAGSDGWVSARSRY